MNDHGKYWDEAWNTVIGCTKCSVGCKNCWAEEMALRLSGMGQSKYQGVTTHYETGPNGWNGLIHCDPSILDKPLHWRKPRTIFVNNMGDTFHPAVPFEFVDKMLTYGTSFCPQHKFLFLTKRPERMKEYFEQLYKGLCKFHKGKPFQWPFKNLYLGTTICNQAEANEKIPILLQIPAAKRWLSIEPMLGPVDLEFLSEHTFRSTKILEGWDTTLIDWVVIGCESGPNRRPCKIEWIESIVNQCKAAGVPVFVKQISQEGKVERDINKFPTPLQIRQKGD